MSSILRTMARATVRPGARNMFSQAQRNIRREKWLEATKEDRKLRHEKRELNRNIRRRSGTLNIMHQRAKPYQNIFATGATPKKLRFQ